MQFDLWEKKNNFLQFTISAFLFSNERPLSCEIEMQIHLDRLRSHAEKLMEFPFNLAKQGNNMLPVNTHTRNERVKKSVIATDRPRFTNCIANLSVVFHVVPLHYAVSLFLFFNKSI